MRARQKTGPIKQRHVAGFGQRSRHRRRQRQRGLAGRRRVRCVPAARTDCGRVPRTRSGGGRSSIHHRYVARALPSDDELATRPPLHLAHRRTFTRLIKTRGVASGAGDIRATLPHGRLGGKAAAAAGRVRAVRGPSPAVSHASRHCALFQLSSARDSPLSFVFIAFYFFIVALRGSLAPRRSRESRGKRYVMVDVPKEPETRDNIKMCVRNGRRPF